VGNRWETGHFRQLWATDSQVFWAGSDNRSMPATGRKVAPVRTFYDGRTTCHVPLLICANSSSCRFRPATARKIYRPRATRPGSITSISPTRPSSLASPTPALPVPPCQAEALQPQSLSLPNEPLRSHAGEVWRHLPRPTTRPIPAGASYGKGTLFQMGSIAGQLSSNWG
jgi:hypothetical protein